MFFINKNIIERVLEESKYILSTRSTIRETAKKFEVSKSTVHKDIHERLMELNMNLYSKILLIMKEHIDERHLRGGESTKRKYMSGIMRSRKKKTYKKSKKYIEN